MGLSIIIEVELSLIILAAIFLKYQGGILNKTGGVVPRAGRIIVNDAGGNAPIHT